MNLDNMIDQVRVVMMAQHLSTGNDEELIQTLVARVDEVLVNERQGEVTMALVHLLSSIVARYTAEHPDERSCLAKAVGHLIEIGAEQYAEETENAAS